MPGQQLAGQRARDHGQVHLGASGHVSAQSHVAANRTPDRSPSRKPASRPATPRFLEAAFAAVAVLILGGCITGFALASTPSQSVDQSRNDSIAGGVGGVSTYGLPFATGTSIQISQGPHADNYRSVTGGYSFTGAGDVAASLDLGALQGTAVKPVASGVVLSAWPACNVVVVDHGGGVWAEYVHVQVAVSPGDYVDRNSTLGYVLGAYDHSGTTCGDHSTGPHVHFAFISGAGKSGTYMPIAGKVLCGHTVDSAGDITGLGTVGGAAFQVPDCNSSGQPIITPTPRPVVTPTPRPVVTPTPKAPAVVTPTPTTPAGFCTVPSLGSPGVGSAFASSQDVSLSWSTNCTQAYVELSGAPYGTLSFGGWQSSGSVHVGQMWPGTYTWHVKGKSYAGIETSWSASWTFTIRNADSPVVTPSPTPRVTDPPAPIVTAPPAPIVTAAPTKTPCPFMDGGNGVTFYTGANFTGQSWTWYVPAGNGDAYADLPSGLFQHLGSFYVSNNAWHVVLYQGENGTGNLGHYDASWANVDSYWRATESVKIYINRISC